MSKTFIRVYAFFAIIVLLGTVGFFSYRIYSNSKTELIDAEKNFKFIAKFISNPPEKIGVMSNAHIDAIKNMCEHSGNIENAMLSTSKNKVLFSWAKGSNKLKYDETGKITLSGNSFITKPYSMRILIHTNDDLIDDKSLTFSAGLNKVSNSLVFSCSRDSFLILSGLLLLTIALVIINSVLNTDTKVYANIQPEPTPDMDFNLESEDDNSPNLERVSWDDLDNLQIYDNENNFSSDINNTKINTNDITDSPGTMVETETEYTPPAEYDHFETETDKKDSNAFSSEADTLNDSNTQNNIMKNEADSNSLYSSNTGLCSESYLSERLESELGRAASSEQNLGLLMLKVNDMKHEDTVAKKIANYLVSEFKFKDMLFEFESDIFVVVMHGANLEESMNTAQKFYADIKEILEIYAYSNKFAIGITTRSARLVPASRLIEEAVSAVEKAFENNDDPIVAFRPDPDLYRKFIADYT